MIISFSLGPMNPANLQLNRLIAKSGATSLWDALPSEISEMILAIAQRYAQREHAEKFARVHETIQKHKDIPIKHVNLVTKNIPFGILSRERIVSALFETNGNPVAAIMNLSFAHDYYL
jgi:NACalpha-BTF3-like transcription factor